MVYFGKYSIHYNAINCRKRNETNERTDGRPMAKHQAMNGQCMGNAWAMHRQCMSKGMFIDGTLFAWLTA